MNQTTGTRKQKPNAAGIILTVLITLGFIWVIYQLLGLTYKEKPLTLEDIRRNELTAYRNIKLMADAQEKYRQKDWDGDGEKTYAMFYVHLWQSVTLKGEPIRVDLIPRILAFAVDTTKMLDGYYFKDFHRRGEPERRHRDLLYAREWALIAQPGIRGKTGRLTFIVDQSGRVYVTSQMYTEQHYPHAPEQNGWTPIDGLENLKRFQTSVINLKQ